jgi:hypothetical protein
MDDSIKVKYKYDKNYNPSYANGAYGGLSPLGEIIIHFYLERSPLPISQTLKTAEGLPTAEIAEFEPDDLNVSIVRFVESGVVLNYETAKEVAKFLETLCKKLEADNNPIE